jgi:hypothetical protein
MSFDTYLFITLLGATLMLISMHPAAWALWAGLIVIAAFRLMGLTIRLLR